MEAAFIISILITISLVGPLVGAVAGAVGKNNIWWNRVVQTVFVFSALAGSAGAIAFLVLQDRGLSVALQSRALELARFIPFFPSNVGSVDHLAGFFLLIINLGALLSAGAAFWYLPRYRDTYSFAWVNAAIGIFVFAMHSVVLSSAVLPFLLFWELMSVSAYFLIIADRTKPSIKAGTFYLVMTQLGFAALVAGCALFGSGDMTASFAALAGSAPGTLTVVAFILVAIGFLGKAGLFPLHGWLPDAHPQAPSHASALMSGVMLNMALYGLLRILDTVLHFNLPFTLVFVLIALGIFSAFYGALMAAVETDIKRMLAWSSIENMGLLFMMTGTISFFVSFEQFTLATFVWIALMIHALNHTLFKSGLFIGAGVIISQTHTRNINVLGGLASRMPLFSKWFFGLTLAAAALPPLGTFYGEWIFMQTLASALTNAPALIGFILIIIMSGVALTAGLALFAFIKLFSVVFLGKARSGTAPEAAPVSRIATAPIALATLLSLGVGLALPFILKGFWPSADGTLYAGATLFGPYGSVAPLTLTGSMLGAYALAYGIYRIFKKQTIVMTDTWDCGAPLTARMEYTGTGFAAPIRFFFRGIVQSRKRITAVPVLTTNRWIATGTVTGGVHSFTYHLLYNPIVRVLNVVGSGVRRLQNGVVQFYILLVFLTLIAVLFVAL